jgi:hypothetical protein
MRFLSFINNAAKHGRVTPRSFTILVCALCVAVVLYVAFGGAWSWAVNVVIFGSMFPGDYRREHWDRDCITKWGEAVAYAWVCNAMILAAFVAWFIYKWATPIILLATIPIMWQGYYVARARNERVFN